MRRGQASRGARLLLLQVGDEYPPHPVTRPDGSWGYGGWVRRHHSPESRWSYTSSCLTDVVELSGAGEEHEGTSEGGCGSSAVDSAKAQSPVSPRPMVSRRKPLSPGGG